MAKGTKLPLVKIPGKFGPQPVRKIDGAATDLKGKRLGSLKGSK